MSLPVLVNPAQRKEGGPEGTRQRANLPAVPLDTTGQGHHGGAFTERQLSRCSSELEEALYLCFVLFVVLTCIPLP